jgi:hypothetical protein
LFAVGVQSELAWWDELTHGWDETRHEKQYIDQKHEDYRYFVWRDGKDKAGHMPHHYKE